MKNLYVLICVCFFWLFGYSQNNSVGSFAYHGDIGHPKNAGSATYDKTKKTYTIKGSGYNIWFNRDEFQYVYNKVKGEFHSY
jgi:hypothetical protein